MSNNGNQAQLDLIESSPHAGQRYWGLVEVIEEGENYRINRIEIKPSPQPLNYMARTVQEPQAPARLILPVSYRSPFNENLS